MERLVTNPLTVEITKIMMEPPSQNEVFESVMLCMDTNNHKDYEELSEEVESEEKEEESDDDTEDESEKKRFHTRGLEH